ncbi:MAG: GNAT family N-acetyltransferase [Candidatus Helarchaeota archaeon]
MKYEIKNLGAPFPYKKVAEILRKTYFKEYLDAGALLWNEKYARFYFGSIQFEDASKKYIFVAYRGDRIIGTVVGHLDNVVLDNELNLKMVNFGLLAVDPEYRRQGIAKALVSKLIETAESEEIDFVMAFPEKNRYGDSLLRDNFGFKRYAKTKHLIKLMEEKGLEVLRDYMNTNPILVKLAALYSNIPELTPPEGIIRKGKSEDLYEVIEIINSYKYRVPLSETYSVEGFQKSIKNLSNMNSLFGDPWNFHWQVLEKSNKIMATLNYRIELATFESEQEGYVDLPVALLTSVGFHEDLDIEQKKMFVSQILHKIRTELPEVFVTQITTCQHEMKVFRKLKFPSDQSSYFLFMKPLTEKGEEINRHKNYKTFFLNYYR